MIRGTLASPHLKNEMTSELAGGSTLYMPGGEQMSIFDATQRYRKASVPLVVVGFVSVRRRTTSGEHPPAEDAESRARTEREFAEAEAYETQWRAENKDHHRERIP